MSATPSQAREGAAFERILGAICSRFGAELVQPATARDPMKIRACGSEFAVRIYEEDGWPSRLSITVDHWRDRLQVRPLDKQIDAAVERIVEFVRQAVALDGEVKSPEFRLKIVSRS